MKDSNKKNNKSLNDIINNLNDDTGKKDNTSTKKQDKDKNKVIPIIIDKEEEPDLTPVIKNIKENSKKEEEKELDPNTENKKNTVLDEEKEKEIIIEENNKTEKKHKKNKKHLIPIIIIITILLFIISLVIYGYFHIRNGIEFKINGEENITLEYGNEYKEEGVIAKVRKRDISSTVITNSNIDLEKLGDYEITYYLNVKYFNYKKTLTRKIHIQDTTKPELVINGDKEIEIYVDDELNYPTYTATDNYDKDITDKVSVESNVDNKKIGNYKITYTVSDSSGNTTTDEVNVNVIKKKKNAYIKISINEQKLYYYEYDKLVLTSDVVTGQYGVSPTPTGTYKVLNKAKNINLIGANYVAFVNYWMAFIGSSYGMHDASWKSVFGGDEYKKAGSHGCVNMPLDKIKQLYALVEVGIPVYIY